MRGKETAKERLQTVPFNKYTMLKQKRYKVLQTVRKQRIQEGKYNNPEIECGC